MIPETREEMFLSAVTDGSGANLQPITREEMYLHAIATGGDTGLTPITRKEMFLDKILKSGGSGGSGGGTGGGSGGSAVSVPAKEVNFYDYDGTLLHAYTVAEAQAMTELPALPERPGLICRGWNYDLETIKAYNRRVDVGATYTTDDGTTRIYIHLEDGRTSPMLGVCPNGTVTVDWGDGTEPDVLTGTSTATVKWTPNHEYAKPGDYVIRLTVEGEVKLTGVQSSDQYACILRYSSGADKRNRAYQNAMQRIEIGDGVTSISNYAFGGCYSLASVVIPDGVTSIGSNAFYYCYSLASVVIPDGVTSIGEFTFNYCCSLTSVVIPDSVTSIGNYTFYYCYSLASVVIHDGVTSIGNNAFYYCCSLTSVVIPDGVTSIGNNAFGGCCSLTSVVIPDGVTSIGNNAFDSCHSLASVVIPDGVTSIGNNAFNYCQSVRYYDFTKHTAVPALSATSVFGSRAADCEIRVPAALYDEWIAETNWATYAANIVAV